jgi:rhodanese-related sulfurtransferase
MFRKLKKIFRSMDSYEISLEELKNKQINGAEIIDVRSEQEYAEGHIDGAINIPEYKINLNITNVLKNKNKEIVLYCQSGHRGKNAYKKLAKLGYKNVYNLYGGLDDI